MPQKQIISMWILWMGYLFPSEEAEKKIEKDRNTKRITRQKKLNEKLKNKK
jgi:hypothetical protein